jgi:hypothetical protein
MTMRTLLKVTTLTAVCVALAAAGVPTASADQIPGEDVYENDVFVRGTSQSDADAAAGRINRGEQLPTWKGPASVVPDGANFNVIAQKLRIVPRTLSKNLTAPAPDQRGVQWHEVKLTPGATYVIELRSGDGTTVTRNNVTTAKPGFFDPVLLVEDDTPATRNNRPRLGFNDDIDWPRNCNSRVTITAPPSGLVRVVVSSYRTGESGPYTIEIKGAN